MYKLAYIKRFGLLLALFMLSWRPALLQSENISLTTYYPAPYGGYDRLLTTGDTYLANSGANVYFGASGSYLGGTKATGGQVTLTGENTAKPSITFKSGNDTAGMSYVNLCSTNSNECKEKIIEINSGVRFLGRLAGLCYPQKYTHGTQTTYCGEDILKKNSMGGISKKEFSKQFVAFPANIDASVTIASILYGSIGNNGFMTFPSTGYMMCCRFDTRDTYTTTYVPPSGGGGGGGGGCADYELHSDDGHGDNGHQHYHTSLSQYVLYPC